MSQRWIKKREGTFWASLNNHFPGCLQFGSPAAGFNWNLSFTGQQDHAKSWLIGKDSDAGRDWGQEEKGTTEDEMAGWHHQFDGHEFEWTPGVGNGQGGLECCNSWGHKESDMTEQLNWTELNWGPEEAHIQTAGQRLSWKATWIASPR